MADNVQTAAEWGQVIENLDLMKRSALQQAQGIRDNISSLSSQRSTLSVQLAAADVAGDTDLMSVIQGRIDNLNRQIAGANLALTNVQRDIAEYDQSLNNAFSQQSTAQSGPPLLNSTVQPASVEPGDPTAVSLPPQITSIETEPVSVSPAEDPFEAERLRREQEFDNPAPTLTAEDVEPLDAGVQAQLEFEQEQNRELLAVEATEPEPVNIDDDPAVRALEEESRREAEERFNEMSDPDGAYEAETKARLLELQQQATIQDRLGQNAKGDWRVRLRIAPDATYLYQDKSNTLMAPLRVSDGIVFPYTPIINTNYSAKYDPYDLTHSNYRGYFYRGSQISDINIQATFTAQDTREAEYVLAVIHFFRSATKMFYGQDRERGAPPPLVYLRGYGEYQFNDHACVISNFQYNLPNDVDYISITPNNVGLNLSNRQAQVGTSPVSTISSAIGRLSNLFNVVSGQPGVPRGAKPGERAELSVVDQTVYKTGQTTYVPTKIDLSITLLPIQTRSQVSKQFSVKEFSNGNLLKKGFW